MELRYSVAYGFYKHALRNLTKIKMQHSVWFVTFASVFALKLFCLSKWPYRLVANVKKSNSVSFHND